MIKQISQLSPCLLLAATLLSCSGNSNMPSTGNGSADTAAIIADYLKNHSTNRVDTQKVHLGGAKKMFYRTPNQTEYSVWIEKGTTEDYDKANGMVQLYLENVVASNPGAYKSVFVKAEDVRKLLMDGVTDVQITFGMAFDEAGKLYPTYMLCGVNAETQKHVYYDNKVLEHCMPCPDYCNLVPGDYYE